VAAKTVRKKKPTELEQLRARAAKALGTSEKEAELRALRELLASLPAASQKKPAPQVTSGGPLPQRLYLMLDGRGLDGRGMPVEVIDLPCVIGSARNCTVWINSPQIETRHLQITRGDEGWVLEDLGSERGTFFGDRRIVRRVLENGDEFRLAGYLRLRAELR
jgi:hypothetical protein